MAASASSADALSEAPPDALDELELEPEPEDELPEEPELAVVEADDAAVDELDSPLLSAVVWDAVSHAAMKKATATSAIRRCNIVMLPGYIRFTLDPAYRMVS
jgi:hypothetical protein